MSNRLPITGYASVSHETERKLQSMDFKLTTIHYTEETESFYTNKINPPPDFFLIEMQGDSEEKWNLLRILLSEYPESELITFMPPDSMEDIARAAKYGALACISTETVSDSLQVRLSDEFERIRLHRLATAREKVSSGDSCEIIGQSRGMLYVKKAIKQAAGSNATVIVTGESGTGKEMVARCIHEFSDRKDQRFVPVNCGAIPDSLIEAELFGSEKGAYTGSHATTEGFFQSAHQGTLFLDEIGNTSENMQAKLLRVLENDTVWKVGSRDPDLVDARVIAASNQSLRNLVKEGEFRADLFYRLHIISIDLPPLRERGDDILLLTYYFVRKNAEGLQIKPPRISDKVLDIFTQYSWPGNVRELENVLKRMMIMNETGNLKVRDLPKHMLKGKRHYSDNRMNMSLDSIEREHIAQIYKHTGGNKTQAAKILGVTRKTLRSKLKKYEII